MRKRSLLLKIVFFGLLLAGFVVMQYSWVQSLKKDKLEEYNTRLLMGIHGAAVTMPLNKLTEGSISKAISRQLGDIPFEFSIASNGVNVASHGFDQKALNDSGNLTFFYLLPTNGKKELSEDQLTVVVSKKFAYRGMTWIYATSLLLTIMMLATFCCAVVLIERKQQLLYENRTNVIRDMMRQLETPLSTVSIAVEALRDARVMHDSGKINYYQQVINEENQRMNEQVNKMLQDLGE
jgi:two-component system phosphate regulon sensor histidine kinase PhoR